MLTVEIVYACCEVCDCLHAYYGLMIFCELDSDGVLRVYYWWIICLVYGLWAIVMTIIESYLHSVWVTNINVTLK